MTALNNFLRFFAPFLSLLLLSPHTASATTVTFTTGAFTQSPFGVVLHGNFLGGNNPYDLGPWAALSYILTLVSLSVVKVPA